MVKKFLTRFFWFLQRDSSNNQMTSEQMARAWLIHCHHAARQKKLVTLLLHQNNIKPDVDGRMEVVAIFLAMAMMMIKDGKLRQAVMNRLVYEMDDAYREQGVYDMVVGRRVKKLTAKLYARLHRYRRALLVKDGGQKLSEVLEFYFGANKKTRTQLSRYLVDCYRRAQQQHNNFSGFAKL